MTKEELSSSFFASKDVLKCTMVLLINRLKMKWAGSECPVLCSAEEKQRQGTEWKETLESKNRMGNQ